MIRKLTRNLIGYTTASIGLSLLLIATLSMIGPIVRRHDPTLTGTKIPLLLIISLLGSILLEVSDRALGFRCQQMIYQGNRDD